MWVLEQGSADHALAWLQALYQREHVDFEGTSALLKAAISAPAPDYFTQLLDVQVFELARGELNHGQHAVSFSYDGLCVRAMRALQGRFHKPAGAWQVRGGVAHIQHVLRDLAGVAPDFSFMHAACFTRRAGIAKRGRVTHSSACCDPRERGERSCLRCGWRGLFVCLPRAKQCGSISMKRCLQRLLWAWACVTIKSMVYVI